ncbi:hypothetical protein Fmac_017954 [Flemingia macrophylla]|uniref:Uncharacterized protein n=1 Tax=Flemingia macrophylla TaxID=520843 RepID=A0ABD1M3M9_9FABA
MGDSCERAEISGGATTRLLRSAAEKGGDSEWKSDRPREPWRGEYVKSIVFGGLDAIVTCFALISSISASTSSSASGMLGSNPKIEWDSVEGYKALDSPINSLWLRFLIRDVLVLGFSNLVADAISMGFGDFVSASSEQDVIIEERKVTKWDVMNQRDKEQAELVRHYQALGMDYNDATMVVNIFTKYNDILVDQRMVADKGMLASEQEVKPWKNGLVTFASFMLFGSTPLLSFIILIPFTDSDTVKFLSACLVSALALALLGVAKARIASQNIIFSVVLTLSSGVIAGLAAYLVGWLLKHVAGLEG